MCRSLEEESKRRRSEQLDALSQQLGSVGTPVAAVAGPEEASVAGPAEAARTPVTSVSVVVLLAALALLWHRRAFLRRRCRELQHGKDYSGREHSGHPHGRDHHGASSADARGLLSRKQSA